MANTPITDIVIYKFPTDTTYRNVYGFYSQSALNTFLNRDAIKVATLSDQQYVRRDYHIEVNLPFDAIEDASYIAYNNHETNSSGIEYIGWEYAFITEKHFVNFNCTRLILKYDVWTNVMKANGFDSDKFRGYVEREHGDYRVSNIYDDVTPNNIIRRYETFSNYEYTLLVVVSDIAHSSVADGSVTGKEFRGNDLDRVGISYMIFDDDNHPIVGTDDLYDYAKKLGASRYVYSTYYCKISSAMVTKIQNNSSYFSGKIGGIIDDVTLAFMYYRGDNSVPSFTTTITVPDLYIMDRDIYDDHKIYTYPYKYAILVTNQETMNLPYEYLEFDSDHNAHIDVTLSFDGNGIYIMYKPEFVNGYNDRIICKYMVSTSTSTDELQAYYGQHILGDIANIGAAIAGQSLLKEGSWLIPAITTGVQATSMFNTVFTPSSHKKGVSIADGYIYIENGEYAIYSMSINAPSIDIMLKMWDSTGYPVNKYKVIDYHTRTLYNYVKARDVSIVNNVYICNSDREEIRKIFEKGVTVWHGGSSVQFGDYVGNSQNTIRETGG